VIAGFEGIRRLLYCTIEVNRTHVKWFLCSKEQYYEYRCYKGFLSVVVFAVTTATRKFTHADIGRPSVLAVVLSSLDHL